MYTTPSNTLYIDQHVQGTGQTCLHWKFQNSFQKLFWFVLLTVLLNLLYNWRQKSAFLFLLISVTDIHLYMATNILTLCTHLKGGENKIHERRKNW